MSVETDKKTEELDIKKFESLKKKFNDLESKEIEYKKRIKELEKSVKKPTKSILSQNEEDLETKIKEMNEKIETMKEEHESNLKERNRFYETELLNMKLENESLNYLHKEGVREKAIPFILNELKKSAVFENEKIVFKNEDGSIKNLEGKDADLQGMIGMIKKEQSFFFNNEPMKVSVNTNDKIENKEYEKHEYDGMPF